MRKRYTNPFITPPHVVQLNKALTDYSIWFHMLEDGEPIEDGLTALYAMAKTLAIALKGGSDAATLRSALVIMERATQRGTWDKSELLTMVCVLQTVKALYPNLPREVAQAALLEAVA